MKRLILPQGKKNMKGTQSLFSGLIWEKLPCHGGDTNRDKSVLICSTKGPMPKLEKQLFGEVETVGTVRQSDYGSTSLTQ